MDKRIEEILKEAEASGKIEEVSAAFNEKMKQKEKEKLVEERFGKIQPYLKKKHGNTIEYWRADYKDAHGDRKQTIAKDRKELVDRLYSELEPSCKKEITVAELFNMFIIERESNEALAANTSETDRSAWNRFIKDSELASLRVADVKVSDIKRFSEKMVGKNKVDQKTYIKAKSLLNLMFDFATDKDIIPPGNPARAFLPKGRKLAFKPVKDNSNDVYSSEDREKLLDYLESIPQTVYTLAVRLAFCFCMRIGELRALEWSDYDAENQKMHIWKQVVAVKKNGRKRSDELVYHTKSNCPEGERYVYVSDEAIQVLKELREINGEKQFILNGINGAQFAISENRFNEHLREFCTAAGVKYYSSHKIRFYGCTELLDAGVPARTVQKIMGHKYASTTEHYDRSKKKDKVDEGIWNDVFGSGLRGSTR